MYGDLMAIKFNSVGHPEDVVKIDEIFRRYIEINGAIDGFEEYVKSGFRNGNEIEYEKYILRGDNNMNVLDYVYAYVTEEGYRGIIRADSKEEAIERKYDFNPNDEVKYIVRLSDLDNDYGVIVEQKINEAIDNQRYIRQYSFDIEGDIDEDKLTMIINKAGLGVKVIGSEWKATWKYGDYKKGKPPINSN